MTRFNKGDVVLVPFPFSDQSITKRRPEVIISSDIYNHTSQDILIMAITGHDERSYGNRRILGGKLVKRWIIKIICC